MDESFNKFLTIREVAKIIGVTPLTLRNWDRKGLLTAYRNPLNNYRLYRYADVADLLAEIRKTKPGSAAQWKIPVTEGDSESNHAGEEDGTIEVTEESRDHELPV